METTHCEALEELLHTSKMECFNLKCEIKRLKQNALVEEYQDLMAKKNERDREYLKLKGDRHKVGMENFGLRNENSKLKEENEKLEKENDKLNFVNCMFLDQNMKYTKKQLICMLDQAATIHKKMDSQHKDEVKKGLDHLDLIIRQKHYYREQCNDLLTKINEISHMSIDAKMPQS
tara:strand:+ start:8 stop:535 length:528 start_codon:yes stop_codon:yes gene_type:complete